LRNLRTAALRFWWAERRSASGAAAFAGRRARRGCPGCGYSGWMLYEALRLFRSSCRDSSGSVALASRRSARRRFSRLRVLESFARMPRAELLAYSPPLCCWAVFASADRVGGLALAAIVGAGADGLLQGGRRQDGIPSSENIASVGATRSCSPTTPAR